MSDNDVSQIKDRLTRLETLFEEKWRGHDIRAEERNELIVDRINAMSGKLDHRPCVEHGELMLSLDHRMKNVEKWQTVVNWAVGVIYGAIVVAIARHIIG